VRARVAALGAIAALASAPTEACAQDPQPATPNDSLVQAKALFKSGLALLDVGDYEGALEQFERSRALVPGKGNTIDVAICLDRLGRYDEALEAYEDALAHYADQLGPEERASIAPALGALKNRTGSLEIAANVDGAVVVDTRARGKLPRTTPLRLLAGSHVVRVIKEGYATCEKEVELAAGVTSSVACTLAPLAETGKLRLEDPSNPEAAVYVDGALLGTAPWEGTLSPGPHLVWITKDGRGTGPTRAMVVKGQTALVRLDSQPLGPPAAIDVEPRTAELTLDDVPLGASHWRGPLPLGMHRIAASEPGYLARTGILAEPNAAAPAPKLLLRLAIDANHPRWPKSIGSAVVGVFGGPAFGGGFGGDAEARCPSACSPSPHALGLIVGARAGFGFTNGLTLSVEGGYLRVETSFARTIKASWSDDVSTHPITYALNDDVLIRGPFFGGSVGVRRTIRGPFALVARTTFAAWIATSTDPITGVEMAGGRSTSIGVTDMNERITSVALLVMPELGAEVKLGPVRLGASLALAFVPTPGPSFHHTNIEARECPPNDPGAVGCAPASRAVEGERAYARIVLFLPAIAATIVF
jgi:hypothetical protein